MNIKFKKNFVIANEISFMNWNKFWFDSLLFILLSALNGLIPICVCLIGASFNPFGTQLTMAIGYLTAIQLGFTQLSWTICLAAIFAYNNYINSKNNIDKKELELNLVSSTIALSFIYGLIITPLFIGTSYAYNTYSSGHINTILGQNQATNYIWGISGYFLFSGFIYSGIIFIQKYKSNLLAVLLLLLFSSLSLGISAALTLGTKNQFISSNNGVLSIEGSYQGLFLGLGFTISSLLMIPIISICLFNYTNIKLKNIFLKNKVVFFIKKTYSPLLTILSIQVIKSIIVIGVGLILTNSVEQAVPISYQLGRNIWYNMLYLLPFLVYGLVDSTLYYGLDSKRPRNNDYKEILVISVFLILFIQIPFMVGMYFSIEPLTKFYLKNNQLWSMDTSKISISYTLETLLKKQEIVDKIKLLNSVDAVKAWLIGLGFSQPQATVVSPLLFPLMQGLTSNDVTAKQNSINAIVKLVQTLKLEPLMQQKFAALFSNANPDSVNKMFDVAQKSYAYIYICIWCTFYPLAQIINSSIFNLKRKFNSFPKAVIILLLQAAAISSIVAFGIELQYSKEWPLYDAWSFPFVVFGPLFLIYSVINFSKQIKK